ncbi:MAG TPA: heme ABC exporter ATP-binding protein CcmA [Gemmatimonadaceae bacterium]
MSEPSLRATDLVRSFGARRAVRGVSLTLGRGDCLALFGPNGAGKTTLLRMLGGLLRPTSGSAAIEGIALPGSADVRARVGLVSHQTMLYEALTARENVEFYARMYGVTDVRTAASDVLGRLGATSFADIRVQSLSRGMQQRVSVARAIVHEPSVLLADEPFTGLDASGAAALTGMLAELRDSGATIIIVTHNLDEALALCTSAAIMREGRFVRLDHAPIPARDEYTALYKELSVDAA